MGYTINDDVKRKIKLKQKELTRKQLKKQLSRNGYGKYTSIETDMVISKAFLTLSGICKNILLLILLKRHLRFKKGKTPICINPDELYMTYKELESPPFGYPPETIRRCLKTILVRGFIKIIHQGGAYQKDKTILRCSLPAIYKMAERGQLACIRWECVGEGTEKPRTTVRFKRSDVLEFIQNHYQPTK